MPSNSLTFLIRCCSNNLIIAFPPIPVLPRTSSGKLRFETDGRFRFCSSSPRFGKELSLIYYSYVFMFIVSVLLHSKASGAFRLMFSSVISFRLHAGTPACRKMNVWTVCFAPSHGYNFQTMPLQSRSFTARASFTNNVVQIHGKNNVSGSRLFVKKYQYS